MVAPIPSSLFRWFAPPQFGRDDLNRGAHALWMASWPFFGVVAVLLGFAVLVEPSTLARRAVTIAAVGIVVTVLHALSRSGRPVLASWLLVSALSVIVTQRAWITGGIHAPVAVFYALFIVMASLLLGQRGAVVTAAICVCGSLVLTVGSMLELAPARPGAGSPAAASLFTLLAISLAMLVQSLSTLLARRQSPSADAVTMLVHDMRSPLHTLLAHLEMLREDVQNESRKDVERAMGVANTLQRIINSLLDAGRLESGRMPVRRTRADVAELAGAVVSAMRVVQPMREISHHSAGDCTCNCDPELIRRVIENLVGNALKHTGIHGRVRVVSVASRDKVRIEVHDQGRGVSGPQRAEIFKPYVTGLAQQTAQFESSGVGLAFCRLAVEAHGGTITIDDAVPRGSIFIVELPR